MQTRTIQTIINDDLTCSLLINDKLFFITHNTLYMQNIYKGPKHPIKQNIKATFIFQHIHDICFIIDNKLTFLTQKGDTIKEVMLKDVITSCKDNCILIAPNNILYFISNYEIKKIRVVQKMHEIVLDVSYDKNESIVLTVSNRIFLCENVIKSERLLLNNELYRMKYEEKLNIKKVEYKKKRLYLISEKGIEICRIKDNLILLHCVVKSTVFFEIKCYDDVVFYVCDKLYVLEDVPLKVCDDKIRYLIQNLAVYEDKLMICKDEEKDIVCYKHIESCQSVQFRVNNLFSFIRNDKYDVIKEKPIKTQEELLIFKKEVDEFRSKYMDRVKIVFLELKTLVTSFSERSKELTIMQSIIEEKMKSVHLKRKALVELLKNIERSLNSNLDATFSEEEYKMFIFRMNKCKEKMMTLRMDSNKSTIMKLKMQRLALQSLIN